VVDHSPIAHSASAETALPAIGQVTDITADNYIEGLHLTRWLLSPLPSGNDAYTAQDTLDRKAAGSLQRGT
jgi:hypothetical protein